MLQIVSHPLVHDILLELRDAKTPPERFRQLAGRISVLLAAEALRDVPTVPETVETPLGPAHGRRVRTDVVLVPVLRAVFVLVVIAVPLESSPSLIYMLILSRRCRHFGMKSFKVST